MICGATNYALSLGGPGICPNCDCGTFNGPAMAQKYVDARERIAVYQQRIAALEAENVRLREALTLIGWTTGRDGKRYPTRGDAEYIARAALKETADE
jgi:hypothetical protein